MKKPYDLPCNIAQSLNLIGDKWTLLILHAVRCGAASYKELSEALLGIPTNLLSKRLKDLCEDGLLSCTLYSAHPPRYQYSLTDKSKDLEDIYNAIVLWGDQHLEKSYKCVTHQGKPVRIVYMDEETKELLSRKELTIENH